MRKFWQPTRKPEQQIAELVTQASQGKLSRRRLVSSLIALGVSASAVGTFVAATDWLKNHDRASPPSPTPQEQRNLEQHDRHIATQTHGTNSTPNAAPTPAALSDPGLQSRLDTILQDYHADAVVEDMLMRDSIQGHDAIRAHKAHEFLSFSALQFRFTRRSVVKDQVVAEWIASGKLDGEFKGLIGNGEAFEIPGVTVVSRNEQGKIVKESIYYDLTNVQRYLRFKSLPEYV